MQLGDGRADRPTCSSWCSSSAAQHQVFDMAAIAKEAGTVVSAVMLGAIAGSGLFPFQREDYEAVVQGRRQGRAKRSLRGFAKAFEIVAPGPGAGRLRSHRSPASAAKRRHAGIRRRRGARKRRIRRRAFPRRCRRCSASATPACWNTRARPMPSSTCSACSGAGGRTRSRSAGRQRLRHHQRDGALAGPVDGVRRHRARGRPQEPRLALAARAGRGEGGRGRPAASCTTTSSPACPSSPRCCRRRWPQRWCAWDRKRVAAGKQPWALPLKIGTHSVFGMLALRALASMKWLRVARQPLRHRAADDRRSGCRAWCRAPSATGSWATRSRCAAA